jgi:hypothetical protein
MEKRIIIVQSDESTENGQNVQIHIEADRASTLELLTLGTRSIMETLSISLYEYLETLMEAKERPLDTRVIVDTSGLKSMGEEGL